MSKLTVFTLCYGISKQNEHRFVNVRINSCNNASTQCEMFVKIDAVITAKIIFTCFIVSPARSTWPPSEQTIVTWCIFSECIQLRILFYEENEAQYSAVNDSSAFCSELYRVASAFTVKINWNASNNGRQKQSVSISNKQCLCIFSSTNNSLAAAGMA